MVSSLYEKKKIKFFIDGNEATPQVTSSENSIEIVYGVLTNFRDIVNGFYSSGLMSEKLLTYIDTESVDDLRDN